ncbi:MAG: glycosyltransferase [Treponema sp.]|nr:glycosyltransferase [Treponema sp.]
MSLTFTVLQSVYRKDNPDFLAQSLQSIAGNTLLPQKVVLVKDGTLTPELESVIAEWQERLPLHAVGYKENKGLAHALNFGLRFVDTELVARMDSDDIAYSNRFEKQIGYMERNPDVALCSGYISEFNTTEMIPSSIRRVPLLHDEIIPYLKSRNAFNHMAVCFRKSAVQEAGGYQPVPYFEDYDLWIRVVQKGFRVANIPELLVNARIGNDMIGRRHGIAYAGHEISFLKRQLKSGFISKAEYRKLIIKRVPVRLLPKTILKAVYRLLRG